MTVLLADTLTRTGISGPTAIEIARQMTAGASTGGVVDRLVAVGVVPMQAIELAAQINAGVFSAHKLCLAMWPPDVAKTIKVASGL